MSAASSGWNPWYTAFARSTSPLSRTIENSVSAAPGSIVVTRTPVPTSSARRLRENWATNAFVAPYTLPPTYGASADFNTFQQSGDIVAETDTRSSATAETLRLTVQEFFKLQKEPVNPDELQGAKDFLAGNFPLTIESPGAIATQVLAHMFYGIDPAEIETFRDRVGRVTTMDIQRVVREFLKPDQLSIVLVGDASVFAGQLKALGFGEFERIPIADLDLSSATLRRPSRQAGGAPLPK